MNNYVTNITTHLKLQNRSKSESGKYNKYLKKSCQWLVIFNSKSSLKFDHVSEFDIKKEILNLFFKEATRTSTSY